MGTYFVLSSEKISLLGGRRCPATLLVGGSASHPSVDTLLLHRELLCMAMHSWTACGVVGVPVRARSGPEQLDGG